MFRLPSRRCNEVRWRNQDSAFVGARRIQVREREGAFAPQQGKESKMPDEKLTGHLVLATSYSRTACRRTTIGAAAFHFRVRNGNGWCHYAIVTRVRTRAGGSLLSQRRKHEAESLGTSGFKFRKNTIFNRHSQVANRKSFLIRWHLHTGFRKCCPPSLKLRRDSQLKASFC